MLHIDRCFLHLQYVVFQQNLQVFRWGPVCNIAVRYYLRPALTNLGRRKPRGLDAFYRQRVVGVFGCAASGAPLSGLCAFFAFMPRPFFGYWVIMWGSAKHLERSSVIIGAAGLGRRTSSNRCALD